MCRANSIQNVEIFIRINMRKADRKQLQQISHLNFQILSLNSFYRQGKETLIIALNHFGCFWLFNLWVFVI